MAKMIEIPESFKPESSVAETFQQLTQLASMRKGYRVETPMPNTLVVVTRYTPTWAAVLGALGIFFLLIGALLWLVKTEDRITIVGQDVDGAASFSIRGVATKDMRRWFERQFSATSSGV